MTRIIKNLLQLRWHKIKIREKAILSRRGIIAQDLWTKDQVFESSLSPNSNDMLDKVAMAAGSNSRFLEYGSGTAAVSLLARKHFDSVTAVEPNPRLNAAAGELQQEHLDDGFPVADISIINSKIQNFNPNRRFDVIYIWAPTGMGRQQEQIHIWRLLKPGGFLIQTIEYGGYPPFTPWNTSGMSYEIVPGDRMPYGFSAPNLFEMRFNEVHLPSLGNGPSFIVLQKSKNILQGYSWLAGLRSLRRNPAEIEGIATSVLEALNSSSKKVKIKGIGDLFEINPLDRLIIRKAKASFDLNKNQVLRLLEIFFKKRLARLEAKDRSGRSFSLELNIKKKIDEESPISPNLDWEWCDSPLLESFR
ncbi:MAG: class I SAM-dependent methyltransferase [Candidatus Saganbacteria bacterium]|nr:class I SAM-dependent methyltransferase [Candidatus Saganbacteria bacterium]